MATQYTAGLTTGQVLTAATMNSIGAVSETYTPVWSSTGTAPAIGNGTLTGRYFRIQKMVFVQLAFVAGSTTTYGTGNYRFTLPLTSRAPLVPYITNGIILLFDASAGALYYGQTGYDNTNTGTVRMFLGAADPAEVGQTTPFTFAINDKIQLNFSYEAA